MLAFILMGGSLLEGVYAITPVVEEGESFESVSEAYEEWLAGVLKAGVRVIQFRPKNKESQTVFSALERTDLAESLKEKTGSAGGVFVVDDDVSLALSLGAGVHLGQEDLMRADWNLVRKLKALGGVLGVSASNEKDLDFALKLNPKPDYFGVSAFDSASKKNKAGGLSFVSLAAEKAHAAGVKVFAVGGINAENAGVLAAAGVDGIAVISAVSRQNAFEDALKLKESFLKGKKL